MKNLLTLVLVLSLCACSSAYYGAMEKVGYHKRDIMKSRVVKMKDSQIEIKEHFTDALDEFSKTLAVKNSTLENKYKALNEIYTVSKSQVAELTERIDSVEKVSLALFKEWKSEIKEFNNPEFKRNSQQQLEVTTKKYQSMMASMREAEKTLDPVLQILKDNVLYLKHNLNAKAINTLQGETKQIEQRVDVLISNMNKAIDEASAFIKEIA